jgi:hypothetical protein
MRDKLFFYRLAHLLQKSTAGEFDLSYDVHAVGERELYERYPTVENVYDQLIDKELVYRAMIWYQFTFFTPKVAEGLVQKLNIEMDGVLRFHAILDQELKRNFFSNAKQFKFGIARSARFDAHTPFELQVPYDKELLILDPLTNITTQVHTFGVSKLYAYFVKHRTRISYELKSDTFKSFIEKLIETKYFTSLPIYESDQRQGAVLKTRKQAEQGLTFCKKIRSIEEFDKFYELLQLQREYAAAPSVATSIAFRGALHEHTNGAKSRPEELIGMQIFSEGRSLDDSLLKHENFLLANTLLCAIKPALLVGKQLILCDNSHEKKIFFSIQSQAKLFEMQCELPIGTLVTFSVMRKKHITLSPLNANALYRINHLFGVDHEGFYLNPIYTQEDIIVHFSDFFVQIYLPQIKTVIPQFDEVKWFTRWCYETLTNTQTTPSIVLES